MVNSGYNDLIICMTHEVAVFCMSGSMIGPVGSAQRTVMRSDSSLRSTLDWAEARDTASTSGTHVSRKKSESEMRPTSGNKLPIRRESAGNERVDGRCTCSTTKFV